MEQEYKLGLFSKILYGGLASALGLFSVFLMMVGNRDNIAVYLFPLLLISSMLLLVVNLLRSKVLITATGITRERAFYSKTLNFEDIKGVRVGSKVIIVEPKEASIGKLRISNYSDLAGAEGLIKWLRERFTDLNKVDIDNERQVMLNDPDLGESVNLREGLISKMRQIAIAYSVWGFIISFLLLFVRNSYASFWAGTLYPVLGIVIMRCSKGLIKFVSNSEKSMYLGISIGFCMPIALLFITGLIEFELLYTGGLLPLTALFSLILFAPLTFVGLNRKASSVYGQIAFMIIVCLMFGFGFTVTTNCLFDKSAPTKFKTTVSGEYISTGKGNHYHLKLNPWYESDYVREIDVSSAEYYRASIGSTVIIYQREGLFDITWFKVDVPSHSAEKGYGEPPNIK